MAGGSSRLTVESESFAPGGRIPTKYTCDGENVSPPISWSEGPEGTREFALLCDDPDAPGGVFVHWVLWGIPKGTTQLKEGIAAGDASLGSAQSGTNSFQLRGYRGPCPPPGKPHRYFFRIFALDGAVTLRAGASRGELDRAMNGHVVAQGEVVGKYGR